MYLLSTRFASFRRAVAASCTTIFLAILTACTTCGEPHGIANTLSTNASVNITQHATLLTQLERGDVEGSEQYLRRMICSDLLVLDNLTRSDALIGSQQQATLKETMSRIEQTPSRGQAIVDSAECDALRKARAAKVSANP